MIQLFMKKEDNASSNDDINRGKINCLSLINVFYAEN